MPLKFRSIAIFTSFLFFVLSAMWMFAPDIMLANWGIVDLSTATKLMSRRSAVLYAGIGTIFLFARNADPSPARSSLVKGIIVVLLGLAALGIFELSAGHANTGILSAVAIEISLALAFLFIQGKREVEKLPIRSSYKRS